MLRNSAIKCVLLLMLPLMLSSCGGTEIDDCLLFEPIYPSRSDTLETRRQILAHDTVGAEKCKWQGYDRG